MVAAGAASPAAPVAAGCGLPQAKTRKRVAKTAMRNARGDHNLGSSMSTPPLGRRGRKGVRSFRRNLLYMRCLVLWRRRIPPCRGPAKSPAVLSLARYRIGRGRLGEPVARAETARFNPG